MKMGESWNYLMTPDRYSTPDIIIKKGVNALFLTLIQFLAKKIELERTVKIAYFLMKSGANKYNSVFQNVADLCVSQQKADGGYIGVEDSVWSIALLKGFKDYFQEYNRGLNFLNKQQLRCGGWGKTSRDIGRIPITGLLLHLLPELSNNDSLQWLENEWKKDFEINPKLTYKGAFSLMALKSTDHQFSDISLFYNTLDWLASQQNEDYGWGPCKGHPVGSTPFCTGITLTGLLQYPELVDQKVIVNGLKWLEKNQLDDGLWPDHYIEEGSAWSFYALTEGYKFLRARQ